MRKIGKKFERKEYNEIRKIKTDVERRHYCTINKKRKHENILKNYIAINTVKFMTATRI